MKLKYNPDCQMCNLYKDSKHVCLYGQGPAHPSLMIIGDQVKENEDSVGSPFRGKSGKALEMILRELDLERNEVYLTNAVKCRGEDKASKKEIQTCKMYLEDEIKRVKPERIVLMGTTAMQSVLGMTGLDKNRRKEFLPYGIPTYVTYHPDVCFYRGPQFASEIAEDVAFALGREEMEETEIEFTWIDKNDIDWDEWITPYMCLDIETNDNTDPFIPGSKITEISVTNLNNEVVYIKGEKKAIRFVNKFIKRAVKAGVIVVGHSFKFDCKFMRHRGLWQKTFLKLKVFDTLVAASFIDENYPNKSLEHLCQVWLGLRPWKTMIEKNRKHYNALDVVNNLALAMKFLDEMKEIGVMNCFNMDMECLKALVEIELSGFHANKKKLINLDKKYTAAIIKAGAKIPVDNPNSNQQIARCLYIDNSIRPFEEAYIDDKIRKIKKSIRKAQRENKEFRQHLSTKEDILVKLINRYKDKPKLEKKRQLCIDVLRYRTLESMRSKFTHGWRKRLREDDCLHGDYKLAKSVFGDKGSDGGTITGRLGMKDPNMMQVPRKRMTKDEELNEKGYITQSLPVSWNIKNVINSRFDGGFIFQGDADQAEMRGTANFTGDKFMIQTYKDGRDLHQETANKIFKVDNADGFKRKKAKTTNFGVIYGGSAWTVANKMNIPKSEAQAFINDHKKEFPQVWAWREKEELKIIKSGQAVNVFGRIRHLQGATRATAHGRAKIREGLNFLIQGPVAELTKYIMTLMTKALIMGNYQSCVIGNVHDAILIDIHPNEKEEVITLFKKISKRGHKVLNNYPIPFIFSMDIGPTWAELKEIQ